MVKKNCDASLKFRDASLKFRDASLKFRDASLKKSLGFFQKRSWIVKSTPSRRTILTKKSVDYINIVYLCQTLYEIQLN